MYQTTFSFPQMVDRTTRKTTLSTNAKSINECLGILLRTRPGEMMGDPEWGCYLIDRVFKYNGVIIEQLIIEDIVNAVQKYEPRVIIRNQDITLVQELDVLKIYIQYEIKESGEINEFNLEITNNDNPYR